MGKRFTATEKWDDPWYRKLDCTDRSVWQFILDKCDNSGVWVVDQETASFFVGANVDLEEFLKRVNNNGKDRITAFDEGKKWLVCDFVGFQYGKLTKTCKPHLRVFDLIEKHKLKGYPKGMNTLEEQEEEKEEEEGGVGETTQKKTFKQHMAILEKKYRENEISLSDKERMAKEWK